MFECATCTEYFSVQDACDYHMDEADHWAECDTCDQTFRSRRASEQHMDALDHRGPTFGCETCHKTFGASSAADQHMDAKNHWAPKVSCVQCGKKFHTQSAVEQHMRDLDHSDHYCRACDRCFDSANSLQMVRTVVLFHIPKKSTEFSSTSTRRPKSIEQPTLLVRIVWLAFSPSVRSLSTSK
jgi:hypothetical protein